MSSPPPIPACDPEAQGYYYPLTPMSEGESLHSFESPGTQWSYPLTETHPPYAYDAAVDSMILHGSPNSPLTAISDGHLDLLSHQSWSEMFAPDTQTNADSPFLTSPMPDNSQVDTDIWLPGFDVDSDVLGDLDTLTSNQTRTQPSPLCEAGAMRLERSFDATGNQEYLFTQNSPQSASFSFVDPDAGLHLDLAEILAPAALRADPGWGLTRESVPWPDSETIADGALLRNRSLRSYPAGMLLEQRGVSTPDTPTLTESSSSFVSTPNTAGSSSASSFMSPSPNPGSSQDEGPGSADLRRATVGSTANVNAARLRRKRPAKFRCDQCGRMFTARHNLQSACINFLCCAGGV
ncbi:hypothetical protein FB45DRAFT_885510 [Roridomyces roridus]|uniref:Uncharacterized protein n=1 Tax=Roridomyces roridus TaxID=1738132 RepID=A0AAD7G1S3_9AGAR|nr:hypothetical protein FB45DRAFT_885510 [Roridomyces roridus]